VAGCARPVNTVGGEGRGASRLLSAWGYSLRRGSAGPESPRERAEVGATHVRVVQQHGPPPLRGDAPGLEDVAAVREGERRVDVLLDEEDRDAAPVDLAQDPEA